MKYPKGTDSHGLKQIAVRFPPSLFDQIITMAKKEKRHFNDMVVELVECGKLCLEESDAMEPKKNEHVTQ